MLKSDKGRMVSYNLLKNSFFRIFGGDFEGRKYYLHLSFGAWMCRERKSKIRL